MFTVMESIRVAWLGVVGNKLRTILTMLGVIIGVAAVIALVSVGQGAQASTSSQIQALGTNLITVGSGSPSYRIEAKDLTELKSRFPDIEAVLPSFTSNQQTVKSDAQTYTVDIDGTGAEYPAVRDRGVVNGDFFTEEDVATRRRVAVLGPTAAENLFPGRSPINQTIRLLGQSFTVIGVAEAKGTGFGGQDLDDRIIVPWTILSRLMGLNRIPALTIKVGSTDASTVVTQQVTDYFSAKFRNETAARVQSQDQLLQTVGSITGIFTLLLGAVAGISLAVGGIGIMNIMLVSVSERTREIGIRKAIGAKKRDILAQFLVEALILSLSGGAIGILIGIGVSRVISGLVGFQAVVTSQSIIVSFVFSLAVGIVFGLYPAYRASNLDPIVALRRD